MKNCKLCWSVSFILIAALGLGAYMFLVRGSVEQGADGRSVVLLNAAERTKVLGEMRGLLEIVQSVTEAAAYGDMEAVEAAARPAGMAAAQAEPAALIGKLPLEFKKLGFATHKAFDDLADLAATDPEPAVLFERLGEVMLNCTACHAGYQFKIEAN